jgi:hypothetical protein
MQNRFHQAFVDLIAAVQYRGIRICEWFFVVGLVFLKPCRLFFVLRSANLAMGTNLNVVLRSPVSLFGELEFASAGW